MNHEPGPKSEGVPLRRLDARLVDGCWQLRDSDVSYLDGAEEALFATFHSTDDLSLFSEHLRREGQRDWRFEYHLAHERANILRPLSIPDASRVLEIGGGCGAITRYLGERFAHVDSLEPMAARARVARARTRDLANVEIFIGELQDVPEAPVYDVIVVVGVLEYIGAGDDGHDRYVDFLAGARRRLAPDGLLVCAIENQLGVKYLAGSPEDHTGRPFEGLEGYPHGGHVRTFSREVATELLDQSGYKAHRFLHAFPDYKFARVLMHDTLLLGDERDLAVRLPHFPSPDRGDLRPKIVDEQHLWHTLVRAKLGPEFSNSFVVIASERATDIDKAIPSSTCATYWSSRRHTAFATSTDVVASGDSFRFVRRRLAGEQVRSVSVAGLVHLVEDSTYVRGSRLTDVLARDPTRLDLLERWRDLVGEHVARGAPCLDLTPRNVILEPNGDLVVIDQEWHLPEVAVDLVLRRGLLLLAQDLLVDGSPQFPEKFTARDIAVSLGEHLGIHRPGWLDDTVRFEADLQVRVTGPFALEELEGQEMRERLTQEMQSSLSTPMNRAPLGLREHELRAHDRADADMFRRLYPPDSYRRVVGTTVFRAIRRANDRLQRRGSSGKEPVRR